MATIVRPLRAGDREQWQPLWDGYNLFYERPDLPAEITETSWERFLDPAEPMFAAGGLQAGIAEVALAVAGRIGNRSSIDLIDLAFALPFAVLLALFCSAHSLAAKFGWVRSQDSDPDRRRIPFAPSVAAALIWYGQIRPGRQVLRLVRKSSEARHSGPWRYRSYRPERAGHRANLV